MDPGFSLINRLIIFIKFPSKSPKNIWSSKRRTPIQLFKLLEHNIYGFVCHYRPEYVFLQRSEIDISSKGGGGGAHTCEITATGYWLLYDSLFGSTECLNRFWWYHLSAGNKTNHRSKLTALIYF